MQLTNFSVIAVCVLIIVLVLAYRQISFEMTKPFKFKFKADRHKDDEKTDHGPDSSDTL